MWQQTQSYNGAIMKQYKETEFGTYIINGINIPKDLGNRHYILLLDELEKGDAEILPYVEPSAPVPKVVTMRQARLALLSQGLLSSVESAIDTLEDPPKSEVRIEWEYSQTVERDRPFVALLGNALGFDEAGIDNLFTLAATL